MSLFLTNMKFTSTSKKILEMHSIVQKYPLVSQLDYIAHSPLKRASETCQGIFGTSSSTVTYTSTSSSGGNTVMQSNQSDDKLTTVLSLDCLREVTPYETLLQGRRPIKKRISALEQWLDKLPNHKTTLLVGHSEYFMVMLGLEEKFKNCDIWKVTYFQGQWTNLELIHRLKENISVQVEDNITFS